MIEQNHECYVLLEVAKLLEQAGFDWECKGYFDDTGFHDGSVECTNYHSDTCKYLKAPTLEVAQRWLRETQKYQVAVLPNGLKGYAALCFFYKEPITQKFEHYSTYEEALEVGIKKVLEIILEKGRQYDS